ncbi:MAG: hypothetical protein IKU23_00615 [Clostridia bacterium]|nr:hypothetical protein [Clostridia bacterium]
MGAFSALREKRKKKKETPTVNSHYTKLARRTALVRYICIVLVVVFAVYSLSFHSDEISIEHFRYMLKYINFSNDNEAPPGTLIQFDGSSGNRGIMFKGNLAVLNESGLTINRWDGEIIYSQIFSTNHPKITENGNNLFCYDLGGKELRIYNTVGRVDNFEEGHFQYPIYWLSAAKNGNFAIISSAKGYRSALYIYDKQFRVIFSSATGDKYMDFVDLADNGIDFVTASHYSQGGNIVTLVTRGKSNTENAQFTQTFVGEIPLGVWYTANGYCLMTSDKMRMFDNTDKIIGEIDFAEKELLSGRIFGDKALVTYRMEGLSGGTEVAVYNLDGSVKYSTTFNQGISDAMITGNTLYVLYPGVLAECNTESGEIKSHTVLTSYSSLLSYNQKPILLSENQAEYFGPEPIKEDEQ